MIQPILYFVCCFIAGVEKDNFETVLGSDPDTVCENLDRIDITYEHPSITIQLYGCVEESSYIKPYIIEVSPQTLCKLLSTLLSEKYEVAIEKAVKDFSILHKGIEVQALQLCLPECRLLIIDRQGTHRSLPIKTCCSNIRRLMLDTTLT